MLLAGLLAAIPWAAGGASLSPLGNTAPTASAGGLYEVNEGAQITFSGDAVDLDEASNLLTYTWDFEFDAGVGFNVMASGVNLIGPTHTYVDNGTFKVALKVTDTALSDSPISINDVHGIQRSSQCQCRRPLYGGRR